MITYQSRINEAQIYTLKLFQLIDQKISQNENTSGEKNPNDNENGWELIYMEEKEDIELENTHVRKEYKLEVEGF